MSTSSSTHEEQQYLDLIKKILEEGEKRPDRTGTGTISLFAPNPLRFSLENNQFPLLTTKKTFFRGVAEELLWFIQGDTNSRHLSEKGVKIWDGNGSRAYLDSLGLTHREEGDLGPVYGFQWRHFGATYVDCHTDYSGHGVDQLAQVVSMLRTDPYSRRILLTAWNPAALPAMALPPCHVLAQFHVSTHGELSCFLYQRSADVGLGVPFNLASYSLLTHMLAHVTGLRAKSLVHMMGDCHIYLDHQEALTLQLQRTPFPFPTLHLPDHVTDLDGFTMADLQLVGYQSHDKIDMKMSV